MTCKKLIISENFVDFRVNFFASAEKLFEMQIFSKKPGIWTKLSFK